MDWNPQKIPNQDLGEGTMVDLPALLSTNLSKPINVYIEGFFCQINQHGTQIVVSTKENRYTLLR